MVKATEMETNNTKVPRDMMITLRIEEKDKLTSPTSSAIGVETLGIIAMNATRSCQKTKRKERSPTLLKRRMMRHF